MSKIPVLFISLSSFIAATTWATDSGPVPLHDGWLLQSADKVTQDGHAISTTQFQAQRWYQTAVPTTVFGALVSNHVYPDPYFGMNLAAVPGASYSMRAGVAYPEHNFSNVPMPPDSPFRSSWWFRKEFGWSVGPGGRRVWLHFDGINYRANVWLNGRSIATAKEMAGAWRTFVFDVTGAMVQPGRNVLAVQVFPPQADDLAISWIDWNPAPPDKNTGIWRDVYLSTTGPVVLRWPHVISRLDSPLFDPVHLTVTAELHNATARLVKGTLFGQIGDIKLSRTVSLAAFESRVTAFSPAEYPQLTMRHPRLWWPARLGPQNLYELKLWFECKGEISDAQTTHFGIREVTSELTENGSRVFRINGRRILIRGAGWAPDMLLRMSPQRQAAEIGYVADMNLNAIRLEGKLEDENFLNLCDQQGVLVMAGWSCCDHWEKWDRWKAEDYTIAAESLRDQIRRLRSHSSVFDWLNGSDYPPPAKIEETYVHILKELDWPNPFQSSASQAPTQLTGATGLKMTGPYEYVPPVYWATDRSRGGAFGFNTETSPGAAVPAVESLRRFLPSEHLWPIDQYWNFHAGRDVPRDLGVYAHALAARYGPSDSLEDFVLKSEVSAFEAERAMFEAFAARKYGATGVIQWMLNNAWPSVVWHLYDYYLRPGGGYFGTKKACEPLHIQYSYDDGSVIVVNSYYEKFQGLTAHARVYDMESRELSSMKRIVDVDADGITKAFVITTPQQTTTYFVYLSLQDASGGEISSNFYWLSAKADTLDWEKGDGYYTPQVSYADFTDLKKLPAVTLEVSADYQSEGAEGLARVTVHNPDARLAFFIHLKVVNSADGEELLPVRWKDNFISLLPGAGRTLTARYTLPDSRPVKPAVHVEGWNVTPSAR